MNKRDPLLNFRDTIEQALYAAEMHPELIRLRPLLRRCLNTTDDTLRKKAHDRNNPASS